MFVESLSLCLASSIHSREAYSIQKIIKINDLYTKNPKESTKLLLELINEVSKVAGHRINN